MQARVLVIWIPFLVGAAILMAGLTGGSNLLLWTGGIFCAAALLPFPLLKASGLESRWQTDGVRRFGAMKFLLFTGPFAGLPLVIVGVLFSLPVLVAAGGGVAILSVLSAVHVAMIKDSGSGDRN